MAQQKTASEIMAKLMARNKGGRLTKTLTKPDTKPRVSFNRGGDDGKNGGFRLHNISPDFNSMVWYVEKTAAWKSDEDGKETDEIAKLTYKLTLNLFTDDEDARALKGELVKRIGETTTIHLTRTIGKTIKTVDGITGEIFTILDGMGIGEKTKEDGERNSVKVLLTDEGDGLFTYETVLDLTNEPEEQSDSEDEPEEQSDSEDEPEDAEN